VNETSKLADTYANFMATWRGRCPSLWRRGKPDDCRADFSGTSRIRQAFNIADQFNQNLHAQAFPSRERRGSDTKPRFISSCGGQTERIYIKFFGTFSKE
jgi:hypothetical protein